MDPKLCKDTEKLLMELLHLKYPRNMIDLKNKIFMKKIIIKRKVDYRKFLKNRKIDILFF
jgi:hypothetical protein